MSEAGSTEAAGGSFITELDHLVVPIRTGKRHQDARLAQVRRDHRRLMDVVVSFGGKVGGMVDTQRADFMTAYEHHIIDVQRELQSLREKVAVIESDSTLKAKLDSLDVNQKKFKEEALNLDTESLDLRKKMRKLVSILHSVEKERDWYLSKLRQAKSRFNYLLEERAKFGGDGLDTSSLYSSSNDSQYTLHIQRTTGATIDDLKARIKGVYGVSRDQALLQSLPHIAPHGKAADSPIQKRQDSGVGRSASPKRPFRTVQEREALGELVALKARQEAIRDFVSQCATSCDKGPWSRVPRRPISELLSVCEEIANQPDDDATEQERLLLAFELAAIPETYHAISDLLAGSDGTDNATRGLQWPPLREGENAFARIEESQQGDDFFAGAEVDFAQGFSNEWRPASEGAAGGLPLEVDSENAMSQTGPESLLDEDLREYLAKLSYQQQLSQASESADDFFQFD